MTYDVMSTGALDYAPCCYGNSRLLFRGPKRRLDAPYVAFLGGTETYGKFIKAPFPALVESSLGVNCVNFGVPNAGIDVFLNDGSLIDAACGSSLTVIQVVGAQNLSNRFYSVHPRRNDRFVTASPLLKMVYPEVDFAEFHFNRHMLSCLQETSDDRFSVVRAEVQAAWLARMRLLLRKISGPVVLVWVADHAALTEEDSANVSVRTRDPLFVTREMLEELRPEIAGLVEVVATPEAVASGTAGMVFSELEAVAAREMLGPQAHGEVARTLHPVLQDLV
ncbi:DUF6473 family protein [uncultured Roseobacter sp.]|uniref:DUF6473 family protein n=1 Tax=uncultured Roseobacter sp. TaxID=114847 RepID=UPI00261DF5B8|nr:DUF6473 family protein [uncultured Roseobacter sp.]